MLPCNMLVASPEESLSNPKEEHLSGEGTHSLQHLSLHIRLTASDSVGHTRVEYRTPVRIAPTQHEAHAFAVQQSGL